MRVLGTGAALPGPAVSNGALYEKVAALAPDLSGRSFEALGRALGINARHLSREFNSCVEAPRPGARNPELAAAAVQNALDDAELPVNALGYMIAHTATPAQPLPPNAAQVAELLCYDGPYVELRQACTGFANALMIASGLLAQPDARPVAIVGSETGSLFFDPARAVAEADQAVNLAQMGDGAGAIILAPAGDGPAIHANWFGAMGNGRSSGLFMPGGGSDHAFSDGHLVFRHDYAAISEHGHRLFEAGIATATNLGFDPARAGHVIPHQASGRIAEQLARATTIPRERVFCNADRVGNTGSAAIWIAFAQLRAGLNEADDVVVLGAEATKHMFGGFAYRHG